jgi:kynureninase
MDRLRAKSLLLTGYLEHLLKQELSEHVVILTPASSSERGCQLSISFSIDLDEASKRVREAGVTCDIRRPNVMRIAPAPLYNSFTDVFEFVTILKAALSV